MKRFFLTLLILSIFCSNVAFAESSIKAYESLKKVESRIKIPISYNDYLKIIGEAQFQVDSYAENRKSKLAGHLQLAMFHYRLAAEVWNVSQSQVNANWEAASRQLVTARKLMK